MDCVKSCNICVNTTALPGSMAKSSYCQDDYPYTADIDSLKLMFIPIDNEVTSLIGCGSFPKHIPVLLNIAAGNAGSVFCIHFHGNACDIGEVAACAMYERNAYMGHYMVVEYPNFGIAKGLPTEVVIDSIARSVYKFAVNELKVPWERIVLIGRSIGTGPACSLASYLQSVNTPPAALVLHAPYTSLSDAAYDLIGCFSFLFLNRWENWTKLCKVKNRKNGGKSSGECRDVCGCVDLQFRGVTEHNPLHYSSVTPAHLPDKEQKCSCSSPEYMDPTSRSVVLCPVLFIHADNDLIIDSHHSKMMHDLRRSAGLTSELFMQISVKGFKKGHNYFDFNKEVVAPSQAFFHRHVPHAAPHPVDLESVRAACGVPSKNCGLSFTFRDPFFDYDDPAAKYGNEKNPMDIMDRGTDATKRIDKSSLINLPDCDSVKCLSRWVLCPYVFCCEASFACLYSGVQYMFHTITNSPPRFTYETKKARNKAHINGCKVVKALLYLQSIESFIKEEEPDEDEEGEEEEEAGSDCGDLEPATYNPLILSSPVPQLQKQRRNSFSISQPSTPRVLTHLKGPCTPHSV